MVVCSGFNAASVKILTYSGCLSVSGLETLHLYWSPVRSSSQPVSQSGRSLRECVRK